MEENPESSGWLAVQLPALISALLGLCCVPLS